MDLEAQIQLITSQTKRLVDLQSSLKRKLNLLENENRTLNMTIDLLKKEKQDLVEKLDVAHVAGQLQVDEANTELLKKQLDKYIREVDSVISGLKKMDG